MIKTVFDINQEERWPILIGNLKNLIKRTKEINLEYSLEVVITNVAINGVKKGTNIIKKEYFEELVNEKVIFYVCNNTMNKFDIKKEELFDFIDIVPAGIVELILKQQEGYSYIKS
ncbi:MULTISPECIES: DsrE family protein [Cetobacterium]|jgi:intracellular sulfur oxidation DsrE/DsrF family protein|uniref:DsrE family protein n=1 Tax=Candidatus Cetobacterium colombiensis TaxID=3073100 RepID=A0ABU4WCK9_9FUSO|nr:DsrE family protein [Candidatus Cetobacterium colombiensis]MDX8337258.1 DsrE family protein [Candidatus Cetobacterium colombiensis]